MKGVSAAAIFRSSWMILAMAVILLLFLSVNWFYFMKIRTGLDREFSIRLESLASLVSSSVDPGTLLTHRHSVLSAFPATVRCPPAAS